MATSYTILLYYKYVPLENPREMVKKQRQLCQDLGILGRILISEEGINGTVAGEPAAIAEYQRQTQAEPAFADIEWKQSFAKEQVFPKLKVKYREEIVTLGVKKQGQDVSLENSAAYIEPHELLELYESGEDFVILDARNAYEAAIGKFQNALIPPIDSFREFPEFVDTQLAEYKDKPVVTYCTGGVRCEKASAYLREQGFTQVKQLHGGVHVYAEATGGKYFEGELFVFDKRLHTPVNSVNPTTVAKCLHCQKPVTHLVDCQEFGCPELFSCCSGCEAAYQSRCQVHCVVAQ